MATDTLPRPSSAPIRRLIKRFARLPLLGGLAVAAPLPELVTMPLISCPGQVGGRPTVKISTRHLLPSWFSVDS